MALRIFIFSVVLGAEYLFHLKSIATYAPIFLGCIISVLAIVLKLGGVSSISNDIYKAWTTAWSMYKDTKSLAIKLIS